VEIQHDKRYRKYDPFILGYVATQVYYMSYPQKTRDKLPWWIVIKTKLRFGVDNQSKKVRKYAKATQDM